MTDLGKCLMENRNLAITLLKGSENNVCDFDADNMPSVLIEYDDMIIDACVSKAYWNGTDVLFYLPDQDAWVIDNEVLSFTANNIYTEIEDIINLQG